MAFEATCLTPTESPGPTRAFGFLGEVGNRYGHRCLDGYGDTNHREGFLSN
jgi:hypothetical protein